MTRYAVLLCATLLAFAGCVAAQTAENTGDTGCEIEGWRWYYLTDSLVIEGATTCPSGRIYIRVYDTSSGSQVYIGNASARIDGYLFTSVASRVPEGISSVHIKYSIE